MQQRFLFADLIACSTCFEQHAAHPQEDKLYHHSLIVTHDNQTDFSRDVTFTFNKLNKWFAANLLFLNLNKTQYVQFMTKKHSYKGYIY